MESREFRVERLSRVAVRPSLEGTRSFSGALLYRHSERGIIGTMICERSEQEGKDFNLRAKRVKDEKLF